MTTVPLVVDNWCLKKAANDFATTSERLEALLPLFKDMPKLDAVSDAPARAFPQRGDGSVW